MDFIITVETDHHDHLVTLTLSGECLGGLMEHLGQQLAERTTTACKPSKGAPLPK